MKNKNEVKNYFVQGAILIDVDGASLNNMGLDSSISDRNRILTKSIKKGRFTYAFVSGQAWRYWWRETLGEKGWNLSPISKEKDNYVTQANPIDFEDDDLFGYMRAPSGQDTYTRKSPLKNSILVSVSPVKLVDEFASLNRQQNSIEDAQPMLYGSELYSAIMKGMFSIDLDQVGTFTSINRSGYQNISTKTKDRLLKEKKVIEVEDLVYKNIKRLRLLDEIRIKRVSDVIKALKDISGGAKLTTNYNSVKPDFIILAVLKGGNNPFDNIAIDENGKSKISEDAIREVLEDNIENFRSDIYIGKANGFMNEFDIGKITFGEDSIKIGDKEVKINFGSVNRMINQFVDENIEKIIKEM